MEILGGLDKLSADPVPLCRSCRGRQQNQILISIFSGRVCRVCCSFFPFIFQWLLLAPGSSMQHERDMAEARRASLAVGGLCRSGLARFTVPGARRIG